LTKKRTHKEKHGSRAKPHSGKTFVKKKQETPEIVKVLPPDCFVTNTASLDRGYKRDAAMGRNKHLIALGIEPAIIEELMNHGAISKKAPGRGTRREHNPLMYRRAAGD
jgi:hypothetical protein